ncbi:MAG: protein-glutamate O-methyltransferase CheR [Pseudomonadota bacterium]
MIELKADQLSRIAEIARGEAGLHLPATKAVFVASRLQRRLRATGVRDFDTYLTLASAHGPAGAKERMHMVSALTTNVTALYREAHHFHLLSDWLARVAQRGRPGKLFLWSAGCASGEEPLCMAATCRRVLGLHWRKRARILATDIDPETLATARERTQEDQAFTRRLAAAPEAEAEASLIADDQLIRNLQAGITYRQHNLLAEQPTEAPFDVIFCRNVTIYFDRDSQREAHGNLVRALNPGGLLALGHSERLIAEGTGLTLAGSTAYHLVQQTENSP